MSAVSPSASYSVTARLSITNRPGMLGRVAMAIGDAGGDIGAVDLVESTRERIVRDITVPGILSVRDVKRMARDPIVFAMANPTPEVTPEEAAPYARIIATGRSDYPNQINNVLCFPGLFRGLLDSRARTVNDEMKLAAARALAGCVARSELSEEYIIPSVFNKAVAPAVAEGVARAAWDTGAARRRRRFDVSVLA